VQVQVQVQLRVKVQGRRSWHLLALDEPTCSAGVPRSDLRPFGTRPRPPQERPDLW
jgi:hypothetical protein